MPTHPGTDSDALPVIDRIVAELLGAIEDGRLVAGQRLIEAEIATDLGVGRNAVREAMQKLEGLGFLNLRRNKSAVIQSLDRQETLEVLAVAEVNSKLMIRCAATNYKEDMHCITLDGVMQRLKTHYDHHEVRQFAQARRHFATALLDIGNNREMSRIFPTIRIHMIISQHMSYKLMSILLSGYQSIAEAIKENNPDRGVAVTSIHVDNLRRFTGEGR